MFLDYLLISQKYSKPINKHVSLSTPIIKDNTLYIIRKENAQLIKVSTGHTVFHTVFFI